jgi:dTMP kinase
MKERGKFITVEGVDGAGKSTHLEYIVDAYATGGRHVVETREPGGTDAAERVREAVLRHPMDPIPETLLLFGARADHVARVIRTALEAGSWVVCDRFTDATVAYQGAGKGVSMELIRQLSEIAHPGLAPDRTFLFDCTYEVSRQRLEHAGRPLDRFEREDRAFFERVRQAYLDRAAAEPQRIKVIDASQDAARVRKQVQAHLGFD